MLYHNAQWIEDIDTVIGVLPELRELAGKKVMITGAAGLVCSAIVDILFRYNDTHAETIGILAAGRWIEEMEQRFGNMVNRDDFCYIPYDASKSNNHFNCDADYIIHGASNAFPGIIVKEPVETMLGNFLGVKELLDYARTHKTQRVLYISSSEVYGKKDGIQPYQEDQYGYIDQLIPRNSYSVGKRAAEALCVSYTDEYHVGTVIVRPGHIYGPTASKTDNRVSSAWAYTAACGEEIIMKSEGEQIRSYCYCLDCASAILKVLIRGEECQAYNISNPDSIISIRELAEILSRAGNVELKKEIPTATEKKGFNPMSNSSLASAKLLGLGWKGCFDAETGIRHTVKILKEMIYGEEIKQ